MKVLVTGVAGFIGSHTAERLSDLGYEVIGIDNFNAYYDVNLKLKNAKSIQAKGVEVLKADLRSSDLHRILDTGFDYIFHFAAQPGIKETSTFEDYLSNNVLATKNLLDFTERCSNLKLFVNAGTSSVYGLEATFSEEKEPKPASYYAVTKLAAEQLVLQKSREGKFKTCSLRLFSVIGPRERPEKMYAKLIACGFNDETFSLYEGSDKHLRSFTYIDDIVDGIVSVIGKETQVDGELINIGTEVEHTTQQGIETVEKILNKKINIEVVAKRKGDQSRTKANITKAKKLLGYNPKTSLQDAVQKQIEWYKENF